MSKFISQLRVQPFALYQERSFSSVKSVDAAPNLFVFFGITRNDMITQFLNIVSKIDSHRLPV